ncbi:MAG: SurA N-terminal domain-containing protein, partial [Proteobacteria bacterium]|nr:SurA N-terminal domain-containing protein [Pseudomonadota bacterium]
MLQGIRQASKSYLMRAFLFVLLIGFGMWGIGDVFYSDPGETPAIIVGDEEVTAREVAFIFDRARRAYLPEASNSEAIDQGLLNQVMLELARQEIFNAEAQRLRLTVTRPMITTAIRLNPLFHDSSGRFSGLIMRDVLARRGLTEATLADEIGNQERRNQYLTPFIDDIEYPKDLLETLALWQVQKRRIRYATLPINPASIATPDNNTLALWYEDNRLAFDIPAQRAATIAIFDPADFAADITISDEELEAGFADRQIRYATPELRDIRQMVFPNPSTATTAKTRLDAGESFEEVASDMLGLTATDIIARELTRDDLALEVADAVFSQPQGEISAPVESPFGNHIFVVDNIIPAETTSLDEVRDELTAELLDEASINAVYDRITLFEDAQSLASGEGDSFDAAAREADARLVTIPAITRTGLDAEGAVVAGITGEMRDALWQQEVGADGILIEDADNVFFAVRVDDETPSRSRTLDEDDVRDEAIAGYQLQQALTTARDQAQTIITGDFATETRSQGLTINTSPAFNQAGEGLEAVADLGEVADALAETSFNLRANESDYVEVGTDRIILINLDTIIDADPAELEVATGADDNSTLLADLARQHNDDLRRDVTTSLLIGLQNLHNLRLRP